MYTRLAADMVGATKMDRPEDVEPSPITGKVYVALHEQQQPRRSERPVDEANPISGNRYGHVVELTETAGQAGDDVRLEHPAALRRPDDDAATYFAGFPKELVSPISCPDNVAFDSEGNLWISTDGAPARSATTTGCSRCRSRATSAATCSSSSRCRARPRRAGR